MPNKDDDSQSPPAPLHDDDVGLFRRLMSGARPLNQDAVLPLPNRPTPRARFRRRDEREVLRESLEADVESMKPDSGENLSYRSSSVGRRSFRKLTRGGFSVQSQIDLHGLTAAEAKTVLAEFVDRSVDRGHLCVRVIHGKGLGSGERGPVLKRKVDTWLRQWNTVLAFVSARQVDGGTGAVYVLLRKS